MPMRLLYLIRHGEPEVQEGPRRCISKTDLPLGKAGIYQSEQLSKWLKETLVISIFSSPLKRCIQTAEIMSKGRIPITIYDNLREMDVGEWENMTFQEIKTKYRDLYEKRGEYPYIVPPPNGESFECAGNRLINCLSEIAKNSNGDIAVIAHSGVNKGALCKLLNIEPSNVLNISQPYCCINTLKILDDGGFEVLSFGKKPIIWPDEFELDQILKKYSTPEEVKRHCIAVGEVAMKLASQISYIKINKELLKASCELHDLARHLEGDHVKIGEQILINEGYPEVAKIVAFHHDITNEAGIEAKLLYLADKLVLGTTKVTLEERFKVSREKCTSLEAVKIHQQRFLASKEIIEDYCLNVDITRSL